MYGMVRAGWLSFGLKHAPAASQAVMHTFSKQHLNKALLHTSMTLRFLRKALNKHARHVSNVLDVLQ